MFTRLWTKCPPMEIKIGAFMLGIVFTRNHLNRPPAVQNLNARIEVINFVTWIGSRPLLRQWFFKIVQLLIIAVSLSKLVGSLNDNKKDVNCVCDPMKSMNATYCLRLISIGSWRSAENVVSNEKYRCLPYNDKLRKLKFFEGPFFCFTAHRGWKTKRSKHRKVSCNYWKGRSLNVVYVI